MNKKNPTTIKPEWIRLPKPGERDIHSGLCRSILSEIIRPTHDNLLPPVESCHIIKPGAKRGIWLINYDSLMSYLDRLSKKTSESLRSRSNLNVDGRSKFESYKKGQQDG